MLSSATCFTASVDDREPVVVIDGTVSAGVAGACVGVVEACVVCVVEACVVCVVEACVVCVVGAGVIVGVVGVVDIDDVKPETELFVLASQCFIHMK